MFVIIEDMTTRRDRKTYVNLPLDPGLFAEMKRLKFRYALASGRDFTWGEFLKDVCDSAFGERDIAGLGGWNVEGAKFPETEAETEVAHMGLGERLTEEGLAEAGMFQDDAMAVQVAGFMPGSLVDLSQRSIDLIVDGLAERLKS